MAPMMAERPQRGRMGGHSTRRVGQYRYEYQHARGQRGRDAGPVLRPETIRAVREVRVVVAAWRHAEQPLSHRGQVTAREYPHRALAALTNRDVDTEDAGQQAHPREPMRGRIAELLLERKI